MQFFSMRNKVIDQHCSMDERYKKKLRNWEENNFFDKKLSFNKGGGDKDFKLDENFP